MPDSSAVITALNETMEAVHALHEEAHGQEHRFELEDWAFSKWFDEIETETHEKLFHYLINRVGKLGGKPSVWTFAWTSEPQDEIGAALQVMLDSLRRVHVAYNLACDIAEDADDYVTIAMIWKHLKRIEKWQVKFEGRLAKYQRLGAVAFAAEYGK